MKVPHHEIHDTEVGMALQWVIPEKIHTPCMEKLKIPTPSFTNIPQIFNLPPPRISQFQIPYHLLDIHNEIYCWFKFTNILLDKSLHSSNYDHSFLISVTPWTNLHLHASTTFWKFKDISPLPSLEGRNILHGEVWIFSGTTD